MFNSKRLSGGLVALALAVAIPVAAQADTSSGDSFNQAFASNAGGWSQSTAYAGLCLPSLLCAGVTDDWVGSGGADGNGYIRTQFSSVASTEAGTSQGVWQSPGFVYNGNAGKEPASVALDLDIRPEVSALVGATAVNDASYRVDVVNASSGVAVSAVPNIALVNDTSWSAIPSAHIDPSNLTIGRTYAIRITTTYHAAVTVVASGEVGYDNVRLTASGTAANTGVNGGSGITSTRLLRLLVRTEALPSSVKLVGSHRLKVTVKCPEAAAPLSCKMVLQGLAHGKGSQVTTEGKVIKMRAGVKRTIRLNIRRAWVKKYQHASHAFIRARVRVGVYKVTVVKRVKISH
jgi:hypothetical protein